MSRPFNPEMSKAWKIHIPATLAGRVEHRLLDPVSGKPAYGARNKLLTELLEKWLSEQEAA